MTDHVLTITNKTPFTESCRRFSILKLQHLPAVDEEGKTKGMLTTIDALEAYNTKQFNRIFIEEKKVNEVIKVVDVMSDYQIYTVNPDDPLVYAYDLLKEQQVHALPVVIEDELVGIITSNDLLKEVSLVLE